jgi:hypothetical protein
MNDSSIKLQFAPYQLEQSVLPSFEFIQLLWQHPNVLTLNFRNKHHSFNTLYHREKNLHKIISEVKQLSKPDMLIVIPYLNPDKLRILEIERVNGMDLCGNAIIVTDDWVLSVSGQPNRFLSETKSVNPYLGKAALVTRALLENPLQTKLDDLQRDVEAKGGQLSQALVSRAMQALEADLIAAPKKHWRASLVQPEAAIDKLAFAWSRVPSSLLWRGRVGVPVERFLPTLFQNAPGRIAMTGLGSITQYASFSLENTVYLYADTVTDLLQNLSAERTDRFANLEIRYCKDPGVFFDTRPDQNGVNWASPLQTFLEGFNGDTRTREAVIPLKARLIAESKARMLEAL